jgi:hypothetical protein
MTTNLRPANDYQVDETRGVVDDVAYLRTVMVNVFFVGPAGAGDREWALVDTGMSVGSPLPLLPNLNPRLSLPATASLSTAPR